MELKSMEANDLMDDINKESIWEGNNLAKILAKYNKGYSEYYFKNLILKAWYSGTLRAKSKSNSRHNYWLLNPEKIVEWVASKGLTLPDELSSLKSFFINKDTVSSENDFYSTELAAANSIHKAISSNRDYRLSFKQQTIVFLEERYPFLSFEAKERIAVLINPDKSKKGGDPKKQGR